MIKTTVKIAALTIGLLVPGVAAAGVSAIVTTDLNIRTGPSSAYQRFDTIPNGGNVTVYGCVRDYDWCDVGWAGTRGWVSGNYLAYLDEGRYRRSIPSVAVSIGLPVIGFDRYDYHHRHYGDFRRDFRREVREERREDRREVRQERRTEKRDIRRERRDVRDVREDVRDARQEFRQARRDGENVREERRELRKERRELRKERRELRRERRDR